MKKCKKVISVMLVFVVIITSCSISFMVKANNKTVDINKELLNTILSNRYWIIETLVDGDISNNPYAVINPSVTSEPILEEVLNNYQNDKAFKALVDAMDIYSNTGEYVSDFADDVLSTFESWFGSSDTADKVVASVDELKYESILNDILQTDYESSWGDTLFSDNMDLENLKQKADVLKKLSSYQTALEDVVGLNHSESSSIVIYDPSNIQSSTYEITLEDYVGHFLNAYEQDLEEYLNNLIEIPALEGNDSLKKKIISTGALAMVTVYEKTVMPETHIDLDDIFYDGMFEDTMKILNGAGKTLDISQKTMDYAILLEALQSQKNTTVQTMLRVSNNTNDYDLAKVCDNYADLVNSAGNEKTLAYESITNYLRNEHVIANVVEEAVKTQASKLIKLSANKFAGAKSLVLSSAIAKAIAIVELSVWVADQTTGIQDTAKKIYICKYVDKIIDEVIKTFYIDLNEYYSNQTDENAEKVLADLQFLKELRLYGEKAAYGSMAAQMDSWVGQLLGGGDTRDYLDSRYQGSIDTYIGCSFSPVTNNEFSLSNGDILNIQSEDVNGKSYTYASLKKASGTTTYFAEADLRLMGGIDLNGAEVNILQAPNGFYLPLIENDTSGSAINIYCDDVSFGTISNSSDLKIEIKKADKTFEIIDSIDNSGTINIINSLSNSKIPVFNINNEKSINLTNCVVDCKGSATNNGTVSGLVNICGDNSQPYDNAYYKIEGHVMNGNGIYSDLTFNSDYRDGISIDDTQTVTNFISNSSTRLRSSENIVVTGNCLIENNYFNSSLGFKDYTALSGFELNGTAKILNNVTFNEPVTINDGLNVTSSCQTLTLNGETNVKGDVLYAGGVINGSDWLKLHGDLNVTVSNPLISNLDFVGKTSQNVKLSNTLTVSKLDNHNTSLSGVNFDSTINVTDELVATSTSAFQNGKNVVLTGNSKVSSNTIKGSISAKDWTYSGDLTIKGTFYTYGTINILDNSDVIFENYIQSNGSLNIGENCLFECNGNYDNKGSLIIGKDSLLNCSEDFRQNSNSTSKGSVLIKGDCVINSSFSGGVIKVNGDMKVSGELDLNDLIFESKVAQKFNNSSSTTVQNLTIVNTSKSGFNVGSVIYVNKSFNENSSNILNRGNIVLNSDVTYEASGIIYGDIVTSGEFTVKEGETLTIRGNLKINGADVIVENGATLNITESITASAANLYVEDGAKLTVSKNLISSNSVFNVKDNGILQVDEYFKSSSDTLNVDSELLINGDAEIINSTVNSSGTITFKGDLKVSFGTWNNPNISFVSKLPQSFSGSSINVNNLTIDNNSKSGITFDSKVNYYGEYIPNSSVIVGENNLVSKA